MLPRRHADRAVEPDGFAVEHRVLDDVHGKGAVFRGRRQAAPDAASAQRGSCGLPRQSYQQRRQEQARRDGVDADLELAKSRAAGSVMPTTPPFEAE